MSQDSLHTNINSAAESLAAGRIAVALEALKTIAPGVLDTNAVEALATRYFYMLRFVADSPQGYNAADVDDIIMRITDMLATAEAYDASLDSNSLRGSEVRYFSRRPEENLASIVSDYIVALSDMQANISPFGNNKERKQLEQLAEDIFKRIWASPLHADDIELVVSIILDKDMPASDRVWWVDALGLGATRFSVRSRLKALVSLLHNDDNGVAAHAAVWCLLIVAAYSDQLPREFAIESLQQVLDVMQMGAEDLCQLIIDSFPSTKSIDFSRLGSISPDKAEKLVKGEISEGDLSDEERETIEKMRDIHRSGVDLVEPMLAPIRQMPFFADISRWFLPFNPEHTALTNITDGEGAEIAQTIYELRMMCDSDKYALLLSLEAMPPTMREKAINNIVDQFRMVARHLGDEGFNLKDSPSLKLYFVFAIQNLSRFFKYFKRLSDFSELRQAWNPASLLNLNLLGIEDKGASFAEKIVLARRPYTTGQLAKLAPMYKMSEEAQLAVTQVVDPEEGLRICESMYLHGCRTMPLINQLLNLGVKTKRMSRERQLEILEGFELEDLDVVPVQRLGDLYIRFGNFAEARKVFEFHEYAFHKQRKYMMPVYAWAKLLNGDIKEAKEDLIEARLYEPTYRVRFGEAVIDWLEGKNNVEDFYRLALEGDNPADFFSHRFKYLFPHIELINERLRSLPRFQALLRMPDIVRYHFESNKF